MFVTEQIQLTLERKGAKQFEIIAIDSGIGNGWKFSPDVLKQAVDKFARVPVFVDHEGTASKARHSARDLGGMLHSPIWDDAVQGIRAKVTPTGPAMDVLIALAEAALENPDLPIGFSVDVMFLSSETNTVSEITRVNSTDAVLRPARGGKFLRALNSIYAKGGILMKETPDVVQVESADVEKETAAVHTLMNAQETVQQVQDEAKHMRTLRLQSCADILKTGLANSKLPAPIITRIEKRFTAQLAKGNPFEPSELQAEIEEERATLAELTAGQVVQGPTRVSAMFSTDDQLQAAVDDMFGVERDPKTASVKAARMSGIRELYLTLTGDYDLHGGYYGERIQLATTADFAGLVKNALNKVVAQQWDMMGKAGYDWWTNIVKVEHFNTLNDITGILMGTVGSLPAVSEQGEYTELAIGDSPETASFNKYGGYIPLTLELIDRDETRKLKAYPVELANAALRRISGLIAAVFTSAAGAGPTMADGGALFNSTAVTTAGGHVNLLTTALGTDFVAWEAVAAAMYNQPMLLKQATGYYGTGAKMAIDPKFLLVPRALRGAAHTLFLPRNAPLATFNYENLYQGQVIPLTVPEWTDATDWAAVADPNLVPCIIVGERFGIKPEIFIAGKETDPAVFMNDEHRIKVRMFNAVLVQDFRGLHKSNV